MQRYLPGSTIRIDDAVPEAASTMMSALFAGGNLMLSQVSNISGLEPYVIQNWVARGYLSAPVGKRYTRRQLSRILIINMLKGILSLEKICRLLSYVNGHLDDESDDTIDDTKLYMWLITLTAGPDFYKAPDYDTCLSEYLEPFPGARRRLEQVLQIIVTAYASADLKHQAEALVDGLQES